MDNPISKGYAFPDPPSPYDLVCFRVYVPNHNLYVGAFWQAYQFFTSWIAWWRDPLKRGREAAAIWRTAYDKARALYEITKGQCEMNVTGVRQHPNDKCVLQVEFDGNNVWVDVANFKDCNGCGGGGAIQFDGVNVSIYNDCTGEFEPSGEPYNPTITHIYDSLYSPDTQGQCNGAANIAAWSKYVSDNSLSIFSTAGVVGAAASFIVGTLANFAGAGFLTESLIASLLAQFIDEGDLFGDAADIDISEELKNILYPYMDEDGTIREPNFTEAITALYARRDEETIDTPERVRWGHETNIMSALGPSVVSRQNKYAGIEDADCSSSGWVETFDFTTGKHGWFVNSMGSAVYETGEGWTDILEIDGFGSYRRTAVIAVSMPVTTLTSARIFYVASLGLDSGDPDIDRTTELFNNAKTTPNRFNETLTQDGEYEFTWSGTQSDMGKLIAQVTVGFNDGGTPTDPGGDLTISKIILSGTGDNPFH